MKTNKAMRIKILEVADIDRYVLCVQNTGADDLSVLGSLQLEMFNASELAAMEIARFELSRRISKEVFYYKKTGTLLVVCREKIFIALSRTLSPFNSLFITSTVCLRIIENRKESATKTVMFHLGVT